MNNKELLEWIENKHGPEIICPYCKHMFDDEIFYMLKTPDWHWPRFCPDCGHEVKQEIKY